MKLSMLAPLALLPLLMACDGGNLGDGECTAEAVASVNVEVVDQDGDPIAPDSLQFTVNGGALQDADCIEEDCSSAVAGWEEDGNIEIFATLSRELDDGSGCFYEAEDSVLVDVARDECHVISDFAELVLDTTQIVCPD